MLLVRSGEFQHQGKIVSRPSYTLIEVGLIETPEQLIERPKKQKRHCSGKKRRHTQKAQLIINQKTEKILAIAFGVGSQHDFQPFKNSRSVLVCQIRCFADAGYQGLTCWPANAKTPANKSKLHPLIEYQKVSNRKLSHDRILVENVIHRLKVFWILNERYQNRRKWFALCFNRNATIHNLELKATA